ncbi:MAG: hypothetical protein AABX76_02330 [Nanoarchaeota archaeon]
MSLFDTVLFREDLPKSFRWDWLKFRMDDEMREKYKRSKIGITDGQIRSREQYFCKNASVFDVAGKKIAWGDVAPLDVKMMEGVYYILSEYKSFWHVPEKGTKEWSFRSKDPNSKSRFQDLLPEFEPTVFKPSYVRRNAIARIVDGEIQTSGRLISRHYQ